MNLEDYLNNAWLTVHSTSKCEISGLMGIVDRNLNDIKSDISYDSKFVIAYNAALTLCTIILYAKGYKASRDQHHFRTIQTLPMIMGDSKRNDAEYLNTCRSKRNTLDYDYAGAVSKQEVDDLSNFVNLLKKEVIEWLTLNYPEYV
ncbi:MAG: hypothetical protein JXB60_09900 [Candidatus Cloacimonetes bacterium]|nr:hypothetical protein [Candidatus Cloacimonadota bacterium]